LTFISVFKSIVISTRHTISRNVFKTEINEVGEIIRSGGDDEQQAKSLGKSRFRLEKRAKNDVI
jgi:hypothetical protein